MNISINLFTSDGRWYAGIENAEFPIDLDVHDSLFTDLVGALIVQKLGGMQDNMLAVVLDNNSDTNSKNKHKYLYKYSDLF